MVRVLKSSLLALAVAFGAVGPSVPAAQAQYHRTYTVYVWECSCHKWVPVYRTTCYTTACGKARYYTACGYDTCVR